MTWIDLLAMVLNKGGRERNKLRGQVSLRGQQKEGGEELPYTGSGQ